MANTEIVEEQKRQLHGLRIRDMLTTLTAATAAISATGFMFAVAPLNGALSFVLLSYVLFVAFYA
ncbi:MAG: hypothetical protein ACK55Z_20670, partial [bacterium]